MRPPGTAGSRDGLSAGSGNGWVLVQDPCGLSWSVDPEVAPLIQQADFSALSSLYRGEYGTVLASRPRRTVVLAELAGRRLVFKITRRTRLASVLFLIPMTSPARRECDFARRLLRLGIQVPLPHGVGESPGPSNRPLSCYLMAPVENASNLDVALRENLLTPNERLRVLAASVGEVARIHAAGMVLPDPHVGNVLIQRPSETPVFLDFHHANFRRSTGRSAHLINLAHFLGSFEEWISKSEFNFLVEIYDAHFHSASSGRSPLDPDRLRETIRRLRHHRSLRHAPSCRRENSTFSTSKSLFQRIFRRNAIPAETLSRWRHCALNPQPAMHRVKESARIDVLLIQEKERAVIVKRYKCPGVKKLVRFLTGQSRSERAWKAAHCLHLRKIAAPQALACWSALRGPDLLFLESVRGTRLLDEMAEQPDSKRGNRQRREMVASLAAFVAKLHEAGVDHPDLCAKNILLTSEGEEKFSFFLVDFDGLRFHHHLPVKAAIRSLAQLNDLPDEWLGFRERLRFLIHYSRARGDEKVPGWMTAISRQTLARRQKRSVLLPQRHR